MTFLDALAMARVRWRRNGDEVSLRCPFCPARRGEEDTGGSLHVNLNSGAGHCWHASCGFKSRHAVAAVLRELRITESVEGAEPEETQLAEPVRLPRDFAPLVKPQGDLDRRALEYLLNRGITRGQIQEHGIGVSFAGRYAWRVVVPVRVGDDLRGIVARSFAGGTPKYLNSPGDKWLFGFDPEAGEVTLAEGVFKALRLERAGRSAAALLGHDLTDNQLGQIRDSACQRVTLWPDPDKAGREGVVGVADKLMADWRGEVRVAWPIIKPADEATLEELRSAETREWSWTVRQKLLLNSA